MYQMNKQEIMAEIAENIRLERLRKHITQAELASEVDISEKYMNMIEKKKSIPSIVIIVNICKALDIDLNTLYKL